MTRLEKQKLFYRGYFHGSGMYQSLKALELAIQYHVGERKDGQEEVSHQFEIAGYLNQVLEGKLSVEDVDVIIAAAFLHDLVEDYPDKYSFLDLEISFTPRVYNIVKALTKWEGFDKNNEDELTKYFDAIGEIPEAVIVKGVDRIHNLQTMIEGLSIQRQKEYIVEIENYFFPMLKKARKAYPAYFFIYLSLSHSLERQIYFIKEIHKR
ncbi:MAG: HD domain-containing protein [bacterium]|nr:HD domain-containing protein [bacterium]